MGDFLAIEKFMSPQEKARVTEVHCCTRQFKNLKRLIETSNMFPKLQQCVSIHDDWWTWTGGDDWHNENLKNPKCLPFCVWDKFSVERTVGKVIQEPLLTELVDLCATNVLKSIEDGERTPHTSSIYEYLKNTPMLLPQLPDKYVVIHPCSYNLPADHRDFTAADWQQVVQYLHTNEMQGIIVNTVPGNDLAEYDSLIPKSKWLTDLTNQTELIASLKIVEQAEKFIGCASVLSVLFSNKTKKDCFLKTTIPHDSDAMWFYYQKSKMVVPREQLTL